MNTWEKIKILNDLGHSVDAIAPFIISASRSTDIPAFYAEWFFNRLEKGYIKWLNPFNQQPQYVSFKNARVIVFWSKNPKPIIPYLKILEQKNINYYFQYTINDYEKEGLEPNVPKLSERIDTFINLSKDIGKEKVIWRFDPLIMTNNITVDILIKKIENIGDLLHDNTKKFVFSFADISVYKKVENNLKKNDISYIEFNDDKMTEFAAKLKELNKKKWKLSLSTCSENINFNQYNIEHNKCIDDDLMIRLFSEDQVLMNFLGHKPEFQGDLFGSNTSDRKNNQLKDKGQRKVCGCIFSKDIGMYNTCNHLCVYCYANYSDNMVKNNLIKHQSEKDSII